MQSSTPNRSATSNSIKTQAQRPVRKQLNQPAGRLKTNIVGIKSTLNPPQIKKNGATDGENANLKEPFTFEELERAWKSFSLAVKREKRDSFYSTLESSKLTMTSDYQLNLEIINSVQAAELEREKGELLDFLRKTLKNYSIGLKYNLVETEKVQVLDSKGTFEKLAEENTSLTKFRKLFNLDIEF